MKIILDDTPFGFLWPIFKNTSQQLISSQWTVICFDGSVLKALFDSSTTCRNPFRDLLITKFRYATSLSINFFKCNFWKNEESFCLCLKLFERSVWKWFPWSWKRNYKGLNHLHSVSVMFGKLGLYPDFNFHFDDYITLTLPFWWLHCLIPFPCTLLTPIYQSKAWGLLYMYMYFDT